MYTPIPPQPTNAQAWLAAAAAVQDAGGEAYNVVIDIADPLAVTGPDDAILTEVDQFLRSITSTRFRCRQYDLSARPAGSPWTPTVSTLPITIRCCRE